MEDGLKAFWFCAFAILVSVPAVAETRFIPLFPRGGDSTGWVYESPALHRTDGEVSISPERLTLRDWTLAFETWNPSAEPLSPMRCTVTYSGSLSLTNTQQDKSRPAVLLVPAQGITYSAETPTITWLGWLTGFEEPHRETTRSQETQNVLFLMIDTLRSDHTPPYGHPFVHAVHTEMMAALGATFVHSYGASSSTRPSVGSIFSGKHPLTHGAERHAIHGAELHEALDVLPEWFLQRGYDTAAVSSNAQITAAYGFDQGFITYRCPVEERQVTPLGIRQLRSLHEPFFLYLHYLAPHAPYVPPYPYKGMYEGMTPYPEQDAYCAEITLDDRRIGEVIAEVARQGLLNRTLIWLFSDHGEEFWEHGWNGHGAKLYEESVQTVSIMMDEQRITPDTRVETPTIHMDVFPTIQHWFGTVPDDIYHGMSMLDTLNENNAYLDRALFLHHGGGLEDAPHESDKQAILQNRKKLIWWPEKDDWELYDLGQDAGEQNNLATPLPDTITTQRDELLRHVEAFRASGYLFEAQSHHERVELTEAEMQNLRDLGYID